MGTGDGDCDRMPLCHPHMRDDPLTCQAPLRPAWVWQGPGSRAGCWVNRAAQHPPGPSLSLLSPLAAGPFSLTPLFLVAPFLCPSPRGLVLLLAGH